MVKKQIYDPILPILSKFESPDFFLWILPLLDIRHCSKLSLYAISRKTYDPNSCKWGKISFWA